MERLLKHGAVSLLTAPVHSTELSPEQVRALTITSVLLVRQDDRIGNLLFVTPLVGRLHQLFPEAAIDILVSTKYPEVLSSHPHIRHLITFSRKKFFCNPVYAVSFLRAIRRSRYSLAIDCKRVFSASNIVALLLARASVRIGFAHRYSRRVYHSWVDVASRVGKVHETELLCAPVMRIWGEAPLPRMEFHFPAHVADFAPGTHICLHIGGRGKKRPPLPFLEGLLMRLTQRGWTVTAVAGPAEHQRAARLSAVMPHIPIIFPPNVTELASVMRSCTVFIGPDTGALHIASALNLPIVNLFPAAASPAYGPRSTRWVVVDFTAPDALERVAAFVEAELAGRHGAPGSGETSSS